MLARAGVFAVSLGGPPCETWSAARHLELESGKGPRPLRSAMSSWGLTHLDQCWPGGRAPRWSSSQRTPRSAEAPRPRQYLAYRPASQPGHAYCGGPRTSNTVMAIWSSLSQADGDQNAGFGIHGCGLQRVRRPKRSMPRNHSARGFSRKVSTKCTPPPCRLMHCNGLMIWRKQVRRPVQPAPSCQIISLWSKNLVYTCMSAQVTDFDAAEWKKCKDFVGEG